MLQDIYALSDTDPSGFTKEISVETGMELASGVAFSHDVRLQRLPVKKIRIRLILICGECRDSCWLCL